MRFAKEHPEDWQERLEAMVTAADLERKRQKEMQDQDPGRWPDWASPTRMRHDLEREREEDERLRYDY